MPSSDFELMSFNLIYCLIMTQLAQIDATSNTASELNLIKRQQNFQNDYQENSI